MCGLLFQIRDQPFSRRNVKQILNSLKTIRHRGPDGEGVMFINSRTGEKWVLKTEDTPDGIKCDGTLDEFPEGEFDMCLGHRRLSIFDLSIAGHQPFTDARGNTIVFNGEIYNFSEIRQELISHGYSFRTKSDTEVICYAYHHWKEKALSRFNGMFSFIIWDNDEKKAFVANDRFGVKPLYFYQSNSEKIFVSEMKQFLAFDLDREVNWNKVGDFLNYGLIDHDQDTLLRDIYRFPNAHFCYLNEGAERIHPHKYYSVNQRIDRARANPEIIRNLFESAVELRLRADVPWGIGASGGLDSSLVLYTADRIQKKNKSAHRVKTFSAISPGHPEDESEFIRFIENDLSIESFYTNPSEGFEMNDFVDHIWHQDAPVLSTSFYAQWKVAKLARENNVVVVLGGQGADEAFAGYHHHFYRYCRYLMENAYFKRLGNEVKGYSDIKNRPASEIRNIITNELKLKYKTLFGFSGIHNSLHKKRVAIADFQELLYLDFSKAMLPYYLRSDDRTAMASSIETRHPFLDYRIVDLAFSLPSDSKIRNGWQKHILRESFDYIPDKLRYRKDKKGFTTPSALIERTLSENFTISDDIIRFCQDKKILFNPDKVNVQSLSIWLNLVKTFTPDE
ncbi:MAG: asparagine synthase (glutamine-hydrolyzing) [Bacteroidota bacterium]|nr:asparagine synthase (glutamine-hydrolyzing) [Bacteroidota bacterium]